MSQQDLNRTDELLDRIQAGRVTDADYLELLQLMTANPEAAFIQHVHDYIEEHATGEPAMIASAADPQWQLMLQAVFGIDKPKQFYSKRAHRIHFLKTAWFRYAAAILILSGVGVYLWTTTTKKDHLSGTIVQQQPVKTDILPGGNKASLTLANGSTIVLDSAANGQIAMQPGSQVIKANGQVIYTQNPANSKEIVLNTMSTPKGGQYQLTLADGTKVWLNAASSITYPTTFIGKERKVDISGEAYLEVAPNQKQPFVVKVKGEQITVLGTHFNVKAYDEEPVRTTLLEGRVELRGTHYQRVLVPGEQGIVDNDNSELQVTNNVNVQEIVAWKNGNFYFDNQNLKSILQDFARWYDVEVVFEGTLKNRTFFGVVKKDKPLSHVLKLLQDNNIQFRIEGRRLIVQSD